MKLRRYLALIGTLAIALSLGAAERSGATTTDKKCAGKQICIQITAQDFASHSTSGSDRYLTDSVRLFNDSSSANLVNITVTMSWTDLGASTTSAFASSFSDPRCTPGSEQYTLSCTTPKSLGPGEGTTYVLVFRTATDTAATHTQLSVAAATKEQGKPSKGGAPPNDAAVDDSNATSYETSPDRDIQTAGGGISVTLATAQVGGGRQFSVLPVPASATATAPQGVYALLEEDSCPSGFTCLPGSQLVTTTTPSGATPVNLQITYTGPLPPATTASSIVVFHLREGASTPTEISTACNGAIFSGQPPRSEWDPNGCRRVRITRLPMGEATVEIDAWDVTNGSWGFG